MGIAPDHLGELFAQNDQVTASDAQETYGQYLNVAYEKASARLSPAGLEELRKAQRAWLSFNELNKIALRAAGHALGLPASRTQEFEGKEFGARSVQLDELFSQLSQPPNPGGLKQVDKDLNIVYQRCIHALPPAEVSYLRQAQRAWIIFRDANRKFGDQACIKIIYDRTWHLHHYYILASTPTVQPSQTPSEEYYFMQNNGTSLDPFERVRESSKKKRK